jgi:hypothetical protein
MSTASLSPPRVRHFSRVPIVLTAIATGLMTILAVAMAAFTVLGTVDIITSAELSTIMLLVLIQLVMSAGLGYHAVRWRWFLERWEYRTRQIELGDPSYRGANHAVSLGLLLVTDVAFHVVLLAATLKQCLAVFGL